MACTLVRLAGCPLRCHYCDTPNALSFKSGDLQSIEQVVATVQQQNRPLVLLTGGEPLAQKNTLHLLKSLAEVVPIVQLETSGAFDISQVDVRIRRILDIKTPGSGESERVKWENIACLNARDEIKFVLTSRDDFDWALTVITEHALVETGATILFSAAWGAIEPATLAEWILITKAPVRLQLQQHKVIWGAEVDGV
ncbi:MAG: radical SAM protein [Mariprofundaceae bacterium]